MNKQSFVNQIFSDVSEKYDIMNDIMSFGVHRIWKKEFVSKIDNLDSKILDLATGSGDILIEIYKRAKSMNANPDITAVDINEDMLKIAKDNLINRNLLMNTKFVVSDASDLSFLEDESFDYVTVVFGIRNFEKIEESLLECNRILKKGGKFLCMEFSKVTLPLFKDVYKLYSEFFIPKIGGIITKNEDAYKYLVDSIRDFHDPITFSNMIKASGFSKCEFNKLSFGICAIHQGTK
jgi:demethylmenaquinone methyltransferase / 2-methoxy-6-polyprenyl-1,4-benzoquinol methylase